MLPQSFTERMQGLLGSEYEEFLASFEHEKYQALRLNPLKKDDMSVSCSRFPGRRTDITIPKRISRESIPGMKRDFIISRNPVPWHL